MSDQGQSEIDQLWTKYSKEDLWNKMSEWWESASHARVVMLLAMHHTEDLSLTEIVQQAGAPEAMVVQVLKDFEKQRVVECHGSSPPKYRISNETGIPEAHAAMLPPDLSGCRSAEYSGRMGERYSGTVS